MLERHEPDQTESDFELVAPKGAPGSTVMVQRTLRAGQRIRHNGNIVVLGDVNPGAEVIASGDIVVVGQLRGVAHAGAMGDEGAIIVAFRLRPSQLRIARTIARSPDTADGTPDQPEVALVANGSVVIRPYRPLPRQTR